MKTPSTMRGLPARRAIAGALVALPVALLLLLAFLAANRAALGRDLPQAEAQVRAAFAAGILQDEDWLPGDTGIGRHQYNDCLILYMAIDQQAPASRLAVSPIKPAPVEGQSMCQALRAYADGDHAAGRTGVWYHQYIHGHTMLVRALLPHLSVEAIRTLYHLVQTGLVLAGILVALAALAGGRERRTENLFWLIVFLAFSRWFGLESYGQSLGHAPSDAILLGYMLFLAVASARGGIGRRAAVIAAALAGALTAIFEFLTGGIPIGLAITIGGLPFALRDEDTDGLVPAIVEASAAFTVAVGACLAGKVLLALAVFGIDAFRESAAQLGVRLGMGAGQPDLGPLQMAKSLTKGLNSLAAGMHVLAGAILATAAGFGLWGARALFRAGPLPRRRATLVVASNLVIGALLLLLWQHTIIHAWFMDRTFVWTIGTGFALFAMAVAERCAD